MRLFNATNLAAMAVFVVSKADKSTMTRGALSAFPSSSQRRLICSGSGVIPGATQRITTPSTVILQHHIGYAQSGHGALQGRTPRRKLNVLLQNGQRQRVSSEELDSVFVMATIVGRPESVEEFWEVRQQSNRGV